MAILDLLTKSSSQPKYPGLVLAIHVISKNVELGSLLGLALGVVFGTADLAVYKRNPLSRILKMCELGISIGTLVGFVQILGKAHSDPTMTAEGIQERAYRITYSVPGIKHKMDLRFLGGGLVGGLVLGLLVPESWLRMDTGDRAVRGYCLGAALASCTLNALVLKKMVNKQLAEM